MVLNARRLSLLEDRVPVLKTWDKDSDARKTYSEVFDDSTLLTLCKMISDGVIHSVEFPISTGKEANVFRCTTRDGFAVAKIFRTSTATFRNLSKYITGDPRFKGLHGNHRSLIYTWARKEFKNLMRMEEAGVRVPHPFACRRNILLMEYLGTPERADPLLKDAPPSSPDEAKALFRTLAAALSLLYRRAGMVHGDFSEYNVMLHGDPPVPVIIDVGQAVLLEHPMSRELLQHDVANMVRFFRKHGAEHNAGEVLRRIRKGGPEEEE